MLERPELAALAEAGYEIRNPYEAVTLFERTMAEFCGAAYAVAVDSATHAIELSLRYLKAAGEIAVPKHTYPSVPMTVLKIGGRVRWTDNRWRGSYRLDPWPVVDSSLRLHRGMHLNGDFTCLSFQHKKRIGIGRGGMILLDDHAGYEWLRRAVHDGRTPGTLWHDDDIQMLGWHYYLTPDDAARGILLFRANRSDFADLGGWEDYPDITKFEVFRGERPRGGA
jgi:dTDP-4-amino-4,6-dideoxygalactose transaminase